MRNKWVYKFFYGSDQTMPICTALTCYSSAILSYGVWLWPHQHRVQLSFSPTTGVRNRFIPVLFEVGNKYTKILVPRESHGGYTVSVHQAKAMRSRTSLKPARSEPMWPFESPPMTRPLEFGTFDTSSSTSSQNSFFFSWAVSPAYGAYAENTWHTALPNTILIFINRSLYLSTSSTLSTSSCLTSNLTPFVPKPFPSYQKLYFFSLLPNAVVHCKTIIVKFTKYLRNFETKTLGKFCKPVCIFR